MTEIVLTTSTLPEPLFRLIRTEKVKVHEAEGEIRLTPIMDTKKGCPLRGLCADGKLSSYSFMERKQAEKELEG
jgi:hypothetical protein